MTPIPTLQTRRARSVRRLLARARDIVSQVPLVLRIPIAIGLLVLTGQVVGVPGTSWATQDSWLFE